MCIRDRIGTMLTAGYLIGNSEIVQRNFKLVVIGIVFLSVLPMILEFMRARSRKGDGNTSRS